MGMDIGSVTTNTRALVYLVMALRVNIILFTALTSSLHLLNIMFFLCFRVSFGTTLYVPPLRQ